MKFIGYSRIMRFLNMCDEVGNPYRRRELLAHLLVLLHNKRNIETINFRCLVQCPAPFFGYTSANVYFYW
jgi:hypothetical protein